MYAVVEAGGRQFELTAGRFVDVDMFAAEPEQEFIFDKVLAIISGADTVLGQPYVTGAKVTGKVIDHVRSSKVVVFKYRAKKGTRKRTGHRQYHTRVFISKIELNDKVLSESEDKYKKEDQAAN